MFYNPFTFVFWANCMGLDCICVCKRNSEEASTFIMCKVNQPLKSRQMINGGSGQHANDRMMDFYFFRKEREGMTIESCRSLFSGSRHTQVWFKAGCVRMCVHERMSLKLVNTSNPAVSKTSAHLWTPLSFLDLLASACRLERRVQLGRERHQCKCQQ